MSILKFGESYKITASDIRPVEAIVADTKIHERFKKIASEIKKIAPKAEDFLYFTAIMMHAAERSLYEEDGTLRKNADGSNVSARWDVDDKTGSWKWVCSDSSIKPYKNNNSDIFPAIELKKAHRQWIGKPLCKDHQSSSVDGIRGIILDTYWDEKHQRIISLCALDKINYSDLARKVSSGYANDVSMGTAVGRSICTECGRVARTEHEYCDHVKRKVAYGEINVDLSPIELSLVVNGADTKAKVLEVLAAAQQLETLMKTGSALDMNDFIKLSNRVDELEKEIKNLNDDNNLALNRNYKIARTLDNADFAIIKDAMTNIEAMLRTLSDKFSTEELMSANISKKSYFQGTEEPTPGKPQYPKEEADKIRNTEDRQLKEIKDLGPVDGMPKDDLEIKKKHLRANIEERRALRAAAVERAHNVIKPTTKVAYPQGTEEVKKYPIDPGSNIRDKEFTFNKGTGMTGMWTGDEKTKEQLSRASLKAVLVKASNVGDTRWDVVADEKVIFSASFNELTNNKPALYPIIASKDFARQLMKNIKSVGLEKAASLYKSAQEPPPPPGGDVPPPPPPAPGGDVPPPPADEPPPADMPAGDVGSEGKPTADVEASIESVVTGLEELNNLLSELIPKMKKGNEALKEEGGELPQSSEGDMEAITDQALADLSSPEPQQAMASLNKLHIVLNAGLRKEFKKVIKSLKACKDESELLLATAKSGSANPGFITNMASNCIKDSKTFIKKANVLQKAFIKYAKGTYALEKRANMEAKLTKEGQAAPKTGTSAKTGSSEPNTGSSAKTGCSGKECEADSDFDLTTIEGRKEYRRKVAATVAKSEKFSDMIGKAHPKGGAKLEGMQGTNENVVEDITEVHDQMMDAVSEEPKVKKAAESLNKLIVAGRINAEDLPEMVKNGLDSAVAAYWKKYYGQVEGGSEFAAALLKDYSKGQNKKAEDMEVYKGKLSKAYDLAYQMANVGLITKSASTIKKEAEKIVNFDDGAYDSLERVVNHHSVRINKTASAPIQNGLALDNDNVRTSPSTENSLYQELTQAFAGRRY